MLVKPTKKVESRYEKMLRYAEKAKKRRLEKLRLNQKGSYPPTQKGEKALKLAPTSKKRQNLRTIGRRGRVNIKANKKLKELYREKSLPECELNLRGCWHQFHGFAHRHKRRWYYGKEELLSSLNQTVKACNQCHQQIEQDAQLTEELFTKLRGDEIHNT